MFGLSSQAKLQPSQPQQVPSSLSQPQQPQPTTVAAGITQPTGDTRTRDPTFEPLERAGRAINDAIRKDDRFPELDTLVQRICPHSLCPRT